MAIEKVRNWQLGRDMDYPYEEARPKKQYAAVFNINKCIACQTCTMACKSTWTYSKGQEHMWWNNVETKPYGGYPQFWDHKLLEKLGPNKWSPGTGHYGSVYSGKTIFEAAPLTEVGVGYLPEDKEWQSPNIYEDTPTSTNPEKGPDNSVDLETTGGGGRGGAHTTWFFYLQRICNHCTHPACLAACPRKAIYKRQDSDGIVLIDQKRCRGYRKCVELCPYKKPMYNLATRISEKCIGCYPRVEQGIEARCMSACVGKIRLQGLKESLPEDAEQNPENPLNYLIHVRKIAVPLYPQYGTEPNIYYIPPRWIHKKFLYQMFGPGIDEALKVYENMDEELLGVLSLFRSTRKIIERFNINSNQAIGYDAKDHELIRVPIDEPVIVRPPRYHNTS